MGWLPDLPDHRDLTPDHKTVKDTLSKHKVATRSRASLPASVDLRQWFPPIHAQGDINSCTAHAVSAIFEYSQKRASNQSLDLARLFLYKVTRNSLQLTGDSGAHIRAAIGALVMFGCPPEKYWPYNVQDYDQEPTPFCYAFAQNFKALKYVRLDPGDTPKPAVLNQIKTQIAAGFPPAFGFTVYLQAKADAEKSGQIPFPGDADVKMGGHAICAVGYDDSVTIKMSASQQKTKGAFLIRNSWSADWGDHGYGWLPYDYVLKDLAEDWWCLLKSDWLETGQFGL
jgi:C1A family cysteine protease